jgi:hypothetical protein
MGKSTTRKKTTGSGAAAATGSASQPAVTQTRVTRAHRSQSQTGQGSSTAKERRTKVERYQAFVRGLQAHQSEANFPTFFADGSFVAKVQGLVTDVGALDKAKAAFVSKRGVANAERSQGQALLEEGEQALVACYGPASDTLVDFGVKPKRPKVRRPRKATSGAAAVAPAPSGGASAASTLGGGTSTSVTAPAMPTPAVPAPASTTAPSTTPPASGTAPASPVTPSGASTAQPAG